MSSGATAPFCPLFHDARNPCPSPSAAKRENREKIQRECRDEPVRSPFCPARAHKCIVDQLTLTHRNSFISAVSHNDLPTKTCAVCNREFEWRKKWEDDWENVKYCSERCRRNKDRDHVPWARDT